MNPELVGLYIYKNSVRLPSLIFSCQGKAKFALERGFPILSLAKEEVWEYVICR